MTINGNNHDIGNILQYFAQDYNNSGSAAKMFNTVLYGLDGTTLRSINIDNTGKLKSVVSGAELTAIQLAIENLDSKVTTCNTGSVTVVPSGDSYTLGYTGTNLTTIVRGSDSKTITLGYSGTNLTSISNWA